MIDTEKIVEGYDRKIIRRLVGYLKPYRLPVLLAVLALIFATASELLVPVVLQRVIDDYIVVTYSRVQNRGATGASNQTPTQVQAPAMPDFERATQIGEWHYVRESDLPVWDAATKKALLDSGILDSESWYVFEQQSESMRYLLQLKSGLFELEEEHGAIRTLDLDLLSRSERRLLRGDDLIGVARWAWILLALLVGTLGFSFVQTYTMAFVGQSIMKSLRIELFEHTVNLRSAYLQTRPVGGLVTRLTNDVETLNELFANVSITLIKDVFMIGGVVVTMLMLDTRLGLVSILTVPPIVIATAFFRLKAKHAFRRVRKWVSTVNAFLSERISGMSIVQMFAAEGRSAKEFRDNSAELLGANLSEVRIFALFRPLVDLFTSVSTGIVLYYGAGLRLREAVSLGVLIAFINLIGKFYRPIQDISEKFTVLQSAMAGGERVFDLLDTDDFIPDSGTFVPGSVRGNVEFEHVVFGYQPEDPVLRDLSFSIAPGERVAVVGFTGAGKTTIINLMARLWDIQSGTIRVDGTDIRSYPLETLRSIIQPVQQDVFLFAGTVEENITLGRDLSRDAVVDAAEAVNARPFIERLSHGFSTEVREAGANLSTGQRQLISFARVLAGNPSIVVLDEATSSVDTETERLIQDGLSTLLKGRTSLTIAHRLSTIRESDRIFVMSAGRLVESGTHNELLDMKGTYATLYRLQYAGGDK